jgi:hypothetical protein
MLSNGSVLVTTYDTITLIDLGILYAGTPQANLCASEQQERLNIPIQLESMPLATRTISYTVSGGSAQPSDYALPGTTLNIAAFEQSGSIPLQIIPDQQADDGETIEITLSSGEDMRLTTNTITVTLHDQGSCQAFFPMVHLP